MATQRRYSIEFKRQVVQEYQAGETLHGLAKRHGISRNLIRIWAAKAEAGEFDDDLAAASILQEYEARIGALERLVGKLALENEFLKGASRHVRPPRRMRAEEHIRKLRLPARDAPFQITMIQKMRMRRKHHIPMPAHPHKWP